MNERGTYVHDLRHRYSVELRPSAELDAQLRELARGLEHAGLVPDGASTQPRFHPHLTIGRTASVTRDVVEAVAAAINTLGAAIEFTSAATFGHGRIIYVQLASDEIAHRARATMVEHTPEPDLDPLMFERAWIPHVTIAYSVPEATRAAALEHIRAQLPIGGAFATVEAWDLDVRPTVRLHCAEAVSSR